MFSNQPATEAPYWPKTSDPGNQQQVRQHFLCIPLTPTNDLHVLLIGSPLRLFPGSSKSFYSLSSSMSSSRHPHWSLLLPASQQPLTTHFRLSPWIIVKILFVGNKPTPTWWFMKLLCQINKANSGWTVIHCHVTRVTLRLKQLLRSKTKS